MKAVSLFARLSLVSALASALAACNDGSTVEPYPANWTIAGDWEVTAGELTFTSEYREDAGKPEVGTPPLSVIDFGTDFPTILHNPGADFFQIGAETFIVDPATGVMEMSKTSPIDLAGTDCDVEASTHRRWELDRDGAAGTGVETTEFRFVSNGAPNACRVFLSTLSDQYLTLGTFGNVFAPLSIFTYLGALDPSRLPLIRVMRVTVPQTLVNTTASEEAPAATASDSLSRWQTQMASGLEQVLRARAEGRL